VPAAVNLLGNFPNPFNPGTSIAFELPRDMRVRLAVYDVRGGLMRSLVDEVQPAGRREVYWDGRDAAGQAAASGVYLYWLRTDEGDFSGRMTLAK
jgi:flagellar hook assembly protein FlgD